MKCLQMVCLHEIYHLHHKQPHRTQGFITPAGRHHTGSVRKELTPVHWQRKRTRTPPAPRPSRARQRLAVGVLWRSTMRTCMCSFLETVQNGIQRRLSWAANRLSPHRDPSLRTPNWKNLTAHYRVGLRLKQQQQKFDRLPQHAVQWQICCRKMSF